MSDSGKMYSYYSYYVFISLGLILLVLLIVGKNMQKSLRANVALKKIKVK